jgi:hypothetical protein
MSFITFLPIVGIETGGHNMGGQRIRPLRADYYREWRKANPNYRPPKHAPDPRLVLAIDGEGLTRDGHHTYNYMAICLNGDPIASVESLGETGLTSVQCLDTILEVLTHAHKTVVGFSLGYDYTHVFRDLPNDKLYRLYRPEMRRTSQGYLKPVVWNGYALNYMRGRLSVSKMLRGKHRETCKLEDCRGCVKGPAVTIWDIFGFYQGSFIKACLDWKVITPAEHKLLTEMKDGRSTFKEDDWKRIKDYCHLECGKLSDLFVRLRDAHDNVGLKLRSYFGAGSTASVLLKKQGAKSYLPRQENTPEAVLNAATYAFFGGRFEISRVGPYKKKVYSYDIASAYPYQIVQLPCLACGRWRRVSGKGTHTAVSNSRFALVRYSVHSERCKDNVSKTPWGPLPFRCSDVANVGPNDSILDDGSIVYPAASGGGWTYRNEYLIAAEHWKVKAHEAWIYETACEHEPFKELASLYLERLRLGKEGPGIVLKLALNSCYGKLAQSVGNAIYQCSLFAGAITSDTRAQLLSLIAQKPDDILSVATDGLVAMSRLSLPNPVDTGTAEVAKSFGKVALGAWEEKEITGGVMLIRPGICFAINPQKEDGEKETRARGIGKTTLERHKQAVLDSWYKNGPKPVTFEHTVFRGAKSCIHPKGEGYSRSEDYGQWCKRKTVIDYNPEPKRPYHTQPDGRLSTWSFPQSFTSAAYDKLVIPQEVRAIIEARNIDSEQPDREELDDIF